MRKLLCSLHKAVNFFPGRIAYEKFLEVRKATCAAGQQPRFKKVFGRRRQS